MSLVVIHGHIAGHQMYVNQHYVKMMSVDMGPDYVYLVHVTKY